MGLKTIETADFAAVYDFDRYEKSWCAVIIDRKISKGVTVGVEFSEAAIIKWCKATLASWPVTGTEAPDAFDRKH